MLIIEKFLLPRSAGEVTLMAICGGIFLFAGGINLGRTMAIVVKVFS